MFGYFIVGSQNRLNVVEEIPLVKIGKDQESKRIETKGPMGDLVKKEREKKERFQDFNFKKEYFCSQRFLLAEVDVLLGLSQVSVLPIHMRQALNPLTKTIEKLNCFNVKQKLLKLKELLLNAECGQPVREILKLWEKEIEDKIPETESKFLITKQYGTLYKRAHPIEFQDYLFLERVKERLERKYSKLNLFPEVLNKKFDCYLIDCDLTINTAAASSYFEYAVEILKKSKKHLNKSDDSLALVLKELIDPELYAQNITDPLVFITLQKNYKVKDEKKPVQVQNYLVNNLTSISRIKYEEEIKNLGGGCGLSYIPPRRTT